MTGAIEIYLDISKPKAEMVKGLNDTAAFAFSEVLQYSRLNLMVFLVNPTGATTRPPYYSLVDNAGMNLKAYVGPRPGPDAILAEQTVFANVPGPDVDGRQLYFTAYLNLNDSRLNAALTGDSLASYLEFHLDRGDGAGYAPTAQTALAVTAAVHDPGASTTPPTPTDIELLRTELTQWALGMFVAWRNDLLAANAGRNLVLSSPTAIATREIGVADDAAPIDNAS